MAGVHPRRLLAGGCASPAARHRFLTMDWPSGGTGQVGGLAKWGACDLQRTRAGASALDCSDRGVRHVSGVIAGADKGAGCHLFEPHLLGHFAQELEFIGMDVLNDV